MKTLSLFSGIGAFEKALTNLGIPYELVGFSEIDKYAVKSYCAIHGVEDTMNLGDITKVDEKTLPNDIDLITYGFPCQDISIAGKQKGLINDDGTQTRSGLFFDALRIIEQTMPKIAIAENVKNLVGKKFNAQFQVVLASLESAGYNNYWKVLNSKGFGVPQNRERVFIVSIRKDIDTGLFEFPEPFPLEKRLKDVLEDDVPEKYYLSDKMIAYLERLKADCAINGNGFGYQPTDHEGIAKTIQANAQVRSTDTLIQIGQMYSNSGNPQAGRIYDAEGISPTMDTCSGGNRMPKVAVAMRGRYNDAGQVEQHIELSDREIANAVTTVQKDSLVGEVAAYENRTNMSAKMAVLEQSWQMVLPPRKNNRIIEFGSLFTETQSQMFTPDGNVKRYIGSEQVDMFSEDQIADISFPNGYNKGNRVFETCPTINGTTTKGNFCYKEKQQPLRIRKLTPKECFRLMGFDDESFHKAEAVNSNTQLYKQAGNSIVVPVLEYIFKSLLECGAL